VHRITINLHNQLYVHPVCSTNVTNDEFRHSTGAEKRRRVSNVYGTYWMHVKFVMEIN